MIIVDTIKNKPYLDVFVEKGILKFKMLQDGDYKNFTFSLDARCIPQLKEALEKEIV